MSTTYLSLCHLKLLLYILLGFFFFLQLFSQVVLVILELAQTGAE